MNAKTTHNLDFFDAPYESHAGHLLDLIVAAGIVTDDDALKIAWRRFRIGTCGGLWRATPEAYEILAVHNNRPGNGHFTDVLEWFEHSCRRDRKVFRIREVGNRRLKRHLLRKQGFKRVDNDDVVKIFNDHPTLHER